MYLKKAHIHFIGIGGIGMSGIATILRHQGYSISGCDSDIDQQSIEYLKKIGCIIHHGNNRTQCNDSSIDIIVYSSAIDAHFPEIIAAQKRNVPIIARAIMLAELMRTKYSIAIAGSHGKTTTTSLIAHILLAVNMDPTVIIGGHLKSLSTNAHLGDGDFLVAEADESDRSLLHLHATLAVITNINLEHLETYRDLDDVIDTFKRFLTNLPFYGKAILCVDNEHIRTMLPLHNVQTTTYGTSDNADIYATDISLQPTQSTFTIHAKHNNQTASATINMPGIHNVQNSLGALALTQELGIPLDHAVTALKTFSGIERRFSFRGTYRDTEVFDDYGHHPKEIEHTLSVARKRTKGRLIVLFQPHRFTRTKYFWNDFITLFLQSSIDHLVIADIYPASEQPIDTITSQRLVQEIKKRRAHFTVTYTAHSNNLHALEKEVMPLCKKNDLLLLQGAGQIFKLAYHFFGQNC